jgi:maleylacetoacetate isomerase
VRELVLYNYWRSSSSHRVRIALAFKGLAYRYVSVDLSGGEHLKQPHLDRSPTGYVPCLSIDGVQYVESVAIIELLEERFPTPALYPQSADDRARLRALVEIVNSGIQPLQNLRVLRKVSDDSAAQRAWAAHFNERGLRAFERAIEDNVRAGVSGRFAYGDAPTAADVFLVPQVCAAERFGVDISAFPRVRAAFHEATRLDAFVQAAPERQPDAPKASEGRGKN